MANPATPIMWLFYFNILYMYIFLLNRYKSLKRKTTVLTFDLSTLNQNTCIYKALSVVSSIVKSYLLHTFDSLRQTPLSTPLRHLINYILINYISVECRR